MEEVQLPLAQVDGVHSIKLNGHQLNMKTEYDDEQARVQLVSDEPAALQLLDVPLLFKFEFRNVRVPISRSSNDTWTMRVVGDAVAATESIKMTMDKEQIINQKACSKYLSTHEGSDVTLSCGHYSVHANKAKLACKSDYFRAMFTSDFKEKDQQEIEIHDVDGETLHAVVMISDDARFRVTDFNIVKIMNVADRFGMDSIVHKCADHLSINSKLSEFTRLSLLDQYKQENCIDELIEMMQSYVAIREDSCFDELSDKCQLKVLRLACKELKATANTA
ncbi:hypothetical protein PFISCL1PPCAC_20066 [Pristionchus fissidentatus]|uniref:BTB domain-containing protein n=1 Tax=Pristionchus fissidentatus TaxID=1538716 RepID=A0AAV5WDG1_9BILA|nr:hypothetical protein PFISCL1PPCAC_20066 [Pristionchus fissidentatus]